MVIACTETFSEKKALVKHQPKQESELALLMREIHANSKEWRQAIIDGDFEGDSIYVYDLLTNSTPTKEEVGGPTYEGFAAFYQTRLDSLMSLKSIELASGSYNNLVSACIQCHEEYCPGPIKTIKKLYISEAIFSKAQ